MNGRLYVSNATSDKLVGEKFQQILQKSLTEVI